jgi:hypothetical protein
VEPYIFFVAGGKARVPARPRPLSPLHTNHVTGKCLTYGPNLSFGITPEQIFNQLIAGLGLCLGCWLSRLRFALFWFLPELWRVEKCFASLRCLFPAFSRKWFGAWFFKRNLLQLRRVQYAVRLWSGSKKSLGPWDQKNSANLSNMSVHLCRYNSGVFRCKKKLEFWYCSTFVCIWQLVSNHELINLKRFVSWFTTKLCN